MSKKNIRICCVAGRSGGHIIPAFFHAYRYKQNNESVSYIDMITTSTSLDHDIVKKIRDSYQDVYDAHIPCSLGNFPGKAVHRYPLFIYQFMRTMLTSMRYFYRAKPEKVISTGGYISIAVCWSAYIMGIKTELFELNAEPGRASSLLKYTVSSVSVCFSHARSYFPEHKTSLIDYPVRFNNTHKVYTVSARRKLGINERAYVIFVQGGSQGSVHINTLMSHIVNSADTENVCIIHQAGSESEAQRMTSIYASCKVDAHVYTFIQDIHLMYSVSDIVIARAGAGSLWDIVYFSKPALIIPLSIGHTAHQVSNAQALSKDYPHLITVFKQDNTYSKNYIASIKKALFARRACSSE
jgi:UDP-N-acetylglucosamine--N-acetylmuramyl-(pentapeptide) pyrophosphoryl-undecaprenol N-acetylglucosamine transferase